MLTFPWTGKRKKKSDATDHGLGLNAKNKSVSDHDSSEPSVSRSTTSTGSIHFGQTIPYTSSVGTSFKEAEYSGRLLLHGLRLAEFPVEAFSNIELLDVVFIDLSDNRLSTLPADFSAFDCLISCIAKSNRFRTIPTCISSFEQLTFLDFSFNEISHLPDSLFDLPLVTLILAGNKVSIIPDAIRRLAPTLAHLDLSRNDLRVLPGHLRFLKSLKVLKLSNNRIEDFPSELCSSLELRTLDLSLNNLSFLPTEFVKMIDLRNLCLSCNPLRSPPLQVVERGMVHIFKWLEGRTSGSSMSVGSQDGLDKKRNVMSAEKHDHHHNESRTTRNSTEPIKSIVHHDIRHNGNNLHRPKELVEPKGAPAAANSKPHNVQVVHNKISSLPSQPVGKENVKHNNTQDEQNNNNNHHATKHNMTALSSPGITKKPISKVAPMMKNARPVANTTNGNVPAKTGIARKTNLATSAVGPKTAAVRNPVVARTRIASAITRKSEEPSGVKPAIKPTTGSTFGLNKAGNRTLPANDVENARKILREKLGPTFAISKNDISFSLQLSDGVELCKFVNKVSPASIILASPTESATPTARSKLNVDRFVQYCKKLGVPETTLCSPLDILSKRNPQKVARTILSVAKLQSLQVSPTNSIQC